MTEENYEYRTSQLMLRNSFRGDGKWEIPIIPKFQIHDGDFDDLLLLGFDRAKTDDEKHRDRMVHFFLYDYKFECVWKQPDLDVEKLSRYRAVLSPDFSMYLEMNPTMQLYNTFRNRWCGAYWAAKGIRVIPTVNWGDESTFDFCFRGIERVVRWRYQPIWHPNIIIMPIRKNGLWQGITRCCTGLHQKRSFAIILRFRKWRETLYLWTMNSVHGNI